MSTPLPPPRRRPEPNNAPSPNLQPSATPPPVVPRAAQVPPNNNNAPQIVPRGGAPAVRPRAGAAAKPTEEKQTPPVPSRGVQKQPEVQSSDQVLTTSNEASTIKSTEGNKPPPPVRNLSKQIPAKDMSAPKTESAQKPPPPSRGIPKPTNPPVVNSAEEQPESQASPPTTQNNTNSSPRLIAGKPPPPNRNLSPSLSNSRGESTNSGNDELQSGEHSPPKPAVQNLVSSLKSQIQIPTPQNKLTTSGGATLPTVAPRVVAPAVSGPPPPAVSGPPPPAVSGPPPPAVSGPPPPLVNGPPPPAVIGPPPRPPPPAVTGPPPKPDQFGNYGPPPAVSGAPPRGRGGGGAGRGGRGGGAARENLFAITLSDPSSIEASEYYPLVLLLTRKNILVARALVSISDPAEIEFLAPALVNVFAATEKITDLVFPMIAEEVANTENKGTLFRGICLQAKVLSACSMLMAREYLKQVLSHPIQHMFETSKCCEVNPDKTSEEKIAENTQNLLHYCNVFLDAIIGSVNEYPNILRHICKQLRVDVRERFPESEYFVIGGFYFLRFICPAIIAPDGHGIVKEVPLESRRGLILISKILQNLANGVEFGRKESYMIPLNDFIVANTSRVQTFFDQLAKTTSNDISHHKVHLVPELMEKVHVQMFLYQKKIFNAIVELEKTYNMTEEAKNFKQVIDVLGTPESLDGVDLKKLKKKAKQK